MLLSKNSLKTSFSSRNFPITIQHLSNSNLPNEIVVLIVFNSFNHRPDVVNQLVGFIIDDPSSYENETRAKKFPLIATEVFQVGFKGIMDSFFVPMTSNAGFDKGLQTKTQRTTWTPPLRQNNPIAPIHHQTSTDESPGSIGHPLEKLLSFIMGRGELNTILTGLFCRLFEKLYAWKPQEFVESILSNEFFLSGFQNHLDASSFVDIFVRLIGQENNTGLATRRNDFIVMKPLIQLVKLLL